MDSITQIGMAIQKYGFTSIIISAIIYLLIQLIMIIVKFYLEQKRSRNLNNNTYPPHKDIDISGLKNYHTALIKIDSLINVRIPLMNLGGPVRTKIFRNMLTIYFKNFKEGIENLLNEDITVENFLFQNEKMVNSVFNQTMIDWKEDGIPLVVISKFEDWNSKRINYINCTISDIDSSKVIDTAVEKQYMALSLYSGVIYLTFIDAEKTLSTLNGSLTGQFYKGEKIEGLHTEV